VDLPPFDKSAMDGYAIPAGAAGDTFTVREMVAAGQPPTAPLKPGEAVRVLTGAPVPLGTGEVVMQEYTQLDGTTVRILRHGDTNICLQGEDVRTGDEIIPAGRTLCALDIANLAGCGLTDVEVMCRPRIAILTTGDEIVDDPAKLKPGRIMNSNGPLLAGLSAARGWPIVINEIVCDTLEAVRDALTRAESQADLTVLSGGVSVGDFDFVPKALEELRCRLLFNSVRLKPGRPTTAAVAPSGKLIVALPGNPVSVFLMYHLFVCHIVARLTGASLPYREIVLPLAASFRRKSKDREEYVPARLTGDGRIEALPFHGSAHLHSLGQADGFLILPCGVQELEAGTPSRFMLLPGASR
jgi:molybdopterin molybdotransferase